MNNAKFKYFGTCVSESDKQIKYKFTLYYGEYMLETTEWQIHNKDLNYDEWSPKTILKVLDSNNASQYKIKYEVETLNGYVGAKEYTIKQSAIDFNLIDSAELKAEVNNENGYISLRLIPIKNVQINGTYCLFRIDDKTNWEQLTKLVEFNIGTASAKEPPNRLIWKDYTIEQGVSYQYLLAQIDKDSISQLDRDGVLATDILTPDFEYLFISDKNKQLRILYNPKMANFKTTLLEKKIDTIGSQFPFFFKNGKIAYKEMSINGLLSFHMDVDGEFDSRWRVNYNDIRRSTTNSGSDENLNTSGMTIKNERDFKLQVLDWLNNGQPKILRSSTEGNYLVRLTNVSLSPEDTLGRMLHSFSATAYEIDNFNQDKLIKYDLINSKYTNQIQSTYKQLQKNISLDNIKSIGVTLCNVPKNTQIIITFLNGNKKTLISSKDMVCLNTEDYNPITNILVNKDNIDCYYIEYIDNFNEVVEIPGVPAIPTELQNVRKWLV